MSQEKADNGTIILDKNDTELGVIKKIYSQNLARLELVNSESVALDLSLITSVTSSGRLLKKKSAVVEANINPFFEGASQFLMDQTYSCLKLIADHLNNKEIKKALQHFEFDFLNKCDTEIKINHYKLLGFIRGIELASKTAQDFIVKLAFQAAEQDHEGITKISPEILVDKLNQEKAFYRILWNLSRLAVAQISRQVKSDLVVAISEAIFEIGLKNIDIEYKQAASTNDIQFWKNRIEDSIVKYIALLLNLLEVDNSNKLLLQIKTQLIPELKKLKINNTLKDLSEEIFEAFNPIAYEEFKTIELLHSGLIGFNLKVMAEKKAMKDIGAIIFTILEEKGTKGILELQKEINKFSREVRDVSKEFIEILQEISQFLKKIEYGDSKVNDYYSSLVQKIQKRKYYDLSNMLTKLNRAFAKE